MADLSCEKESFMCFIAGAPNCGKTSLFNRLTAKKAIVGNREGVTVTEEYAKVKSDEMCVTFCDLPGVRSCGPDFAPDEEVSIKRIKSRRDEKDILILAIPLGGYTYACQGAKIASFLAGFWKGRMIIALTQSDLVKESQSRILCRQISQVLKVPCVAVTSKTKDGVDLLKKALNKARFIDKLDGEELWKILKSEIPKEDISKSKVDKILLHPIFGRVILLFVILFILFLSFGKPTMLVSELIEKYILSIPGKYIRSLPVSGWLIDFLCDGIYSGVCAILLALPAVCATFLSVAFLESVGYLPRASALTDKMMKSAGLSGDSFIPVLLGLGCTVPAIMCTRTIQDSREREKCCRILPIISCSARTAIYSTICREFFPSCGFIVCFCMYILTFVFFFLWSFIFSKGRKGVTRNRTIPPLKKPDFCTIMSETYLRTKDFILRAGSIIFLNCAVIYILSNVSIDDMTILEMISRLPSILLTPLGFGNTRTVSALIVGIGSKESVVSSLASTAPNGNPMYGFEIPEALSFGVFSALYCPCTATMSCIRKEQGTAEVFKSVFTCLISAYACSYAVYRLSALLCD